MMHLFKEALVKVSIINDPVTFLFQIFMSSVTVVRFLCWYDWIWSVEWAYFCRTVTAVI